MDAFDDLHDGLANHFSRVSKLGFPRWLSLKADRERLLPQEPPYDGGQPVNRCESQI